MNPLKDGPYEFSSNYYSSTRWNPQNQEEMWTRKNVESDEVAKVSVPLQSVVDHQSYENRDCLPDDDACKSQKEGICQKN